MEKKCKQCSLTLDKRNKTGYCVSHRKFWRKMCNSCSADIYAGSKTNLCKSCYYKSYYSKNKEKINSFYNNYYHLNKANINKVRARREKKRWHSDIVFKLKKTMRSRFKKAMNENWISGSFTKNLGCTIPELKKYLESQFQPGMSWDNYGHLWQIDHIVAFCSVDLTDIENLKKVAHYTNLQPLWINEHHIKTTTDRKIR